MEWSPGWAGSGHKGAPQVAHSVVPFKWIRRSQLGHGWAKVVVATLMAKSSTLATVSLEIPLGGV